MYYKQKQQRTPWILVHKRTIPSERPPLVGEVSANFFAQELTKKYPVNTPFNPESHKGAC
jgi:hypothetical protein